MSKNRLAIIVSILLLGNVVSSEAKICIGCSANIADSANYCTNCMTPQPETATIGKQSMKKEPREVILDLFHFIDDYEANFHNVQYLNILGKMPEVKTMFQNASMRYKNIEQFLPEECKLLANIYAIKYQLFDGITNVMKNLRIDSGFRAAIVKSALLSMSYYNKIIDQFRVRNVWDSENLSILKKQIQNVNDRIQKYQITAKYLKLGDTKVPNGQNIMILGINGKNAHVMYMGPSITIDPVEGNVSLKDLEKRTTWQRTNEFFFQDIPLRN